jgi:hypothetical protein
MTAKTTNGFLNRLRPSEVREHPLIPGGGGKGEIATDNAALSITPRHDSLATEQKGPLCVQSIVQSLAQRSFLIERRPF